MATNNGSRLIKSVEPYVTSPFGWRTLNGVRGYHLGVDYGTNGKKVPCYALENGYVVRTWQDTAGALGVDVAYPRLGYVGVYVHLDKINVTKGQNVTSETKIGNTGKTGNATGVHLHFGWYPISDINVAYANRGWTDFEAYIYPEEEKEEPVETVERKYKVGDKVVFTGTLYADSYGGGAGQSRTNLEAVISKVNDKANATKPYLINDGLGWVAESDLSISSTQENVELKIGDRVKSIDYGRAAFDGSGNRARIGSVGTITKIRLEYPYPYEISDSQGVLGRYKASGLQKI